MNISHQIKLCRENKGYSQEYLAEKLYVSRQTISNGKMNVVILMSII